ncbi:MAG: hypothetical protein VW495_14015 [Rhodobiaceae bacterium]
MRRTGMNRASGMVSGMKGGIMMVSAVLTLAGCGHEAYEDSYPATSGVIVDGGAGTAPGTIPGTTGGTTPGITGGITGSAMDDQPAGQTGEVTAEVGGEVAPGPAAGQSGTILFMASPGNGQPPQVIARTDSVTSLPTAEFLAREALASQYGTSRQATASQQQAPAASTQMTAPLVVTADQDQTSPIILPVVPATPLVGSSPAGSSPAGSSAAGSSPNGSLPANSRIRISRQTGVDDGPTVLRIIEAP